jgi:hypothetical protein
MIHQCPCGFATDDRLWFESHQARHLLAAGSQSSQRDYDVSSMTVDELRRVRRELEASLALARPGSMTSVPIMAQIQAIDAALSGLTGLPGPPVALGARQLAHRTLARVHARSGPWRRSATQWIRRAPSLTARMRSMPVAYQ